MKVTLTEPELAGDYIVAERGPDGSVQLVPDTSLEGIQKRIGGRPMTPDEFSEHFGALPRDDEGMFGLRGVTWVVLIGLAVGGTLLNQTLGGAAIGSYTVLIGGLLLTSLTDRDRFYAADLTRERRRTQGSAR